MRRIASLLVVSLIFTAATARADTIVLDNGDRINGTIVETNEDATVIDGAVFGKVTIPHGRIVSVEPTPGGDEQDQEKAQTAEQAAEVAKSEGTADASAMAVAEVPEVKEVRPGLFGTDFLKGWDKSIGAGINGTTGNTEAVSFNFSLSLFFEDDKDRWDLQAAYYYSKSSGSTTQDQAFALARKDWLFAGTPWFIFAQVRYDYDAFKDWDSRISASLGVGYDFVKNDDFRLSGRVGLGTFREFGGTNDNWQLEALLGLETEWKITENQTLSAGITFYPALTDLGEYRFIATLDYIITVDKKLGLSLKFGLQDEYISNSGTADNNDFLYYGQLVYEF